MVEVMGKVKKMQESLTAAGAGEWKVERADGHQEYWLGKQRHRVGGPAIIRADGTKLWYEHGRPHRVDGPAVEGQKRREWYFNGRLHRMDGPAIECADGRHEWWLRGKKLGVEEGEKMASLERLKNAKLEVPEKVSF